MNLIEQNLAAQDNILAALTDIYAQTANVRKNVEEVVKRREITISSLIASYDAYEDLLTKSSKGLEFYRKLEINVAKLLQRVKSTCKVQEEEREQILAQDSKNTYEKTDATIPLTYDQGRARSNNGLKLKDYLNSRVESGNTGYQNPYYNLYKGAAATMQMDSVSKSLVTDMGDKNLIQSPSTVSPEIPSSSVKSSQHYYPATYTDYRMNSPYPYSTQTYYENLVVSSAINQNYLPTTSTSITNVYQQPETLSASTAGASNASIQYPASSYVLNGQTPSTSTNGQDKFHGTSHSNYSGISNTALQYDAYQSPGSYNSYNVATSPYVPNPNQEKATAIVKSGTAETSSQMQTIPQIPISTIGTAASTVSTDGGQIYNVAQQNQQYDNQQNTVLSSQELPRDSQTAVKSQQTLSAKDNTLAQNYSLAQTAGHSEIAYPQNYQSTVYYNPAELPTQRVSFTHDTTVIAPMQYIQSQQPNTSNQSIQSVTSASDISYNSSSLPGINPIQYSQQTNMEQSKQNYTDNAYASYGTQVQMNPAAPNYPSTYQNYQNNIIGTTYQQNILPTDTSCTYAYLNSSSSSEIIQSHAKPTTVQSYSQSYPYSHQGLYSGYVQYPNYSQSQNYAYMQNARGTNTLAYTYNPTGQIQDYTYNAANNPSTTQNSQALEATVSITPSNVTTSNIYQQETNARYTNAGNNAVVSQTASSQYNQIYQPQMDSDTYYTTPYGLQMQGQGIYYNNRYISLIYHIHIICMCI